MPSGLCFCVVIKVVWHLNIHTLDAHSNFGCILLSCYLMFQGTVKVLQTELGEQNKSGGSINGTQSDVTLQGTGMDRCYW